jgi:hypothetical protein
MRFNWLAIPLVAGVVSACSSSSGGSDTAGEAGVIGCGGDSRVQSYKPGMGQMGASGVFRFDLASATPQPQSSGTEVWVVRIQDASGKPVTDATFPSTPTSPNPRPWMPEHGHGTSVVAVTNNHDGTYTFDPMYLYMLGIWETDIVAESGGKTDATKFFFCLQ